MDSFIQSFINIAMKNNNRERHISAFVPDKQYRKAI